MASAELNRRFRVALQSLGTPAPAPTPSPRAATTRRQQALDEGREPVTRIGNQSTLILDPDLDSDHTMSLILLRYPAQLDVVAQITPRLHDGLDGFDGVAVDPADRPRLFVLEGELRAAGAAIQSDYAEALAASKSALLSERLSPTQAALSAAIDRFRAVVRQAAAGERVERSQNDTAERGVLQTEQLLRNALARGEMRLVFQPQVGAVDGTLRAVEALLRWRSPELGCDTIQGHHTGRPMPAQALVAWRAGHREDPALMVSAG